MQRSLPLALGLAALVAGAAQAHGPDRVSEATHPLSPARVKLADCSRSSHSAVFYARMRRVRGARRLGLRLTLLSRAGGQRWQVVEAPGLGRWRWSRRGVRAFGYRQRVRGLAEGSAYRMVVAFRWRGRGGCSGAAGGRAGAPRRDD